MPVKLAFMAIRREDGSLEPLSKKEVKIFQMASNVEFRYLPELKEFFSSFCDSKFDIFEYRIKKLINVPLKFFNPPLKNEFVRENGFRLRIFMEIFKEGNDFLLEKIMQKVDW
jgi:hypothetical protein